MYRPGLMRRSRSLSAVEELSKLQFDFLDLSELIHDDDDLSFAGGIANSTQIENIDKRRHTITNPNSLQYMTSLVDLDGRSLSQDDLYYLKDKMNALDDLMKEKPNHVTQVIQLADEVHRNIEIQERKDFENQSIDLNVRKSVHTTTTVTTPHEAVPILIDGRQSGDTRENTTYSNVVLITESTAPYQRRVSFVPEVLTDDEANAIEKLKENVDQEKDRELNSKFDLVPAFGELNFAPPLILSSRSKSAEKPSKEKSVPETKLRAKSGHSKVEISPAIIFPTFKPEFQTNMQSEPKVKRPKSLPIVHETQEKPAREVNSSKPNFSEFVFEPKLQPQAETATNLIPLSEQMTFEAEPELEKLSADKVSIKRSTSGGETSQRSESFPNKASSKPTTTEGRNRSWPPPQVVMPAYNPVREEGLIIARPEVASRMENENEPKTDTFNLNLEPSLTMDTNKNSTMQNSIVLNEVPLIEHRPEERTDQEEEPELNLQINLASQNQSQETLEIEPIRAQVDFLPDVDENAELVTFRDPEYENLPDLNFAVRAGFQEEAKPPSRETTPRRVSRTPTRVYIRSPSKSSLRNVKNEREPSLKNIELNMPTHVIVEAPTVHRESPRDQNRNEDRSVLNMSIVSISEEPELEEAEAGLMDEMRNLPQHSSSFTSAPTTAKTRIPRKQSSHSIAAIETKKFPQRQTSTPKTKQSQPVKPLMQKSKSQNNKSRDESPGIKKESPSRIPIRSGSVQKPRKISQPAPGKITEEPSNLTPSDNSKSDLPKIVPVTESKPQKQNLPDVKADKDTSIVSDLEITQSTIQPDEIERVQADPSNRKRFLDSVNPDHITQNFVAPSKGSRPVQAAGPKISGESKPQMIDRTTSFIVEAVTKDEFSQTEVDKILCEMCQSAPDSKREKTETKLENSATQTLAWQGVVRSNTVIKKELKTTDTQTDFQEGGDVTEPPDHEKDLRKILADKSFGTSPVPAHDIALSPCFKLQTLMKNTQTDLALEEPDEKPKVGNLIENNPKHEAFQEEPDTVPTENFPNREVPTEIVKPRKTRGENIEHVPKHRRLISPKRFYLQRDFPHPETFESIRLMMSPDMLDDMQSLDQFQKECLLSHNMFRVKHRAPPLKWNSSLSKQAQRWANYLVSSNTLQHSNEYGYSENVLKKRLKFSEPARGFGIVHQWYKNGAKEYDYGAGLKQKLNRTLQAFIKMVWSDIEDMGIGYSFDNENNIVVVSHYKPKIYVKNITANVFPKL